MCREYEHFDILEVAVKCGIKLYPNRNSNVEFKARCPFCGDTKYHLGINRQKERFNCFKCGESGNSVSLYAKIYGVSNKEAYDKAIGPRDYIEIVTGKYYILNADNQFEEAKVILKLSGFSELSDHSLVKVENVSSQDKKFILVEFTTIDADNEMDFVYRWCEVPECITEERVMEIIGG